MYPEAIVLYKMPDSYIVMGDDAEVALKTIANTKIINNIAFLPNDLSTVSDLASLGREIRIVTYLNMKQELDLPDVELMEQERLSDY